MHPARRPAAAIPAHVARVHPFLDSRLPPAWQASTKSDSGASHGFGHDAAAVQLTAAFPGRQICTSATKDLFYQEEPMNLAKPDGNGHEARCGTEKYLNALGVPSEQVGCFSG